VFIVSIFCLSYRFTTPPKKQSCEQIKIKICWNFRRDDWYQL